MKKLEERIVKDGRIGAGNVLKVDSFVNHQIDTPFLYEMAEEFHRLYKDEGINKILTIEASGISIATLVALKFDCPLVFAKKTVTNNIYGDVYTAQVYSYTHEKTYQIVVAKDFLKKGDRVLVIDDFLANGEASLGLCDLVHQAGATVVGIGICVEKRFQPGHERLKDYKLVSLAKVTAIQDGQLMVEN